MEQIKPSLPIAAYIRLSKQEQASPDSIAALKFQVREAARELGEELADEWILEDIMSGGRNDRPNFQKLVQLIENQSIRIVIVRLDRLSRKAGTFLDLSKLFEKSGVRLFDVLKRGFIDFSNPGEWGAYQRSGIDAEQESRVNSRRIRDRKKFMRHQGKVQGGKMPFGYKRSSEGKYEIREDQRAIALQMVEIFLECGSSVAAAREIYDRLGILWTYQGLAGWLQKPVLRGHTPYLYDNHNSKQRKYTELLWNTHEALISEDVGAQIDRAIEANRRIRGRNKSNRVFPLSGLLYCDRCGATAHICTWRTYANIYCSAHRKGTGCGGRIDGETKGKMGKVGTPYQVADDVVLETLRKRGEDLIRLGFTNPETPKELPEVIALREQILKYEALAKVDPDLLPVLVKKRNDLQSLIRDEGDRGDNQRQLQEKLIRYAQIPGFWQKITQEEFTVVYWEFVDRVYCDQAAVRVLLKV